MTNYNIAVDALEEAAKFRLFEKAAAAENINLADMSETDVEDLYAAYNKTHEVNTMNDQLIDLFEKQAAYEGVDLDSLSDDELAYVYNNFLENLAEEEEEEEDYGYSDEQEAYEKLAEAEILGRHMARAYVDELDIYGFGKEASVAEMQKRKETVRQAMLKAMGLKSMSDVKDTAQFEAALKQNLKNGAGKTGPTRVTQVSTDAAGNTYTTSSLQKSIDAQNKSQAKKTSGKQKFESSALGQEISLNKQERELAKKRRAIAQQAKEERLSGLSIKEQNAIAKAEHAEGARKGAFTNIKNDLKSAKDYVTGKARGAGTFVDRKAQNLGVALGGTVGKGGATSRRLRGYGALGAVGGLAGGAAYGLSQMGKEASTLDLFEAAAIERAQEMVEFGKEAGFNGDHVDTFAVEILQEAGYDISPLMEEDFPLFDEEYGWY